MSCGPPFRRGSGTYNICGCECPIPCCPPTCCRNPKVTWTLTKSSSSSSFSSSSSSFSSSSSSSSSCQICCPSVPDILYAHIYNMPLGCECWNCLTIRLDKNGCNWIGSIMCSSSSSSISSGISELCCDSLVPSVLFATFGGSLAALGTVTLTYVAGPNAWFGNGGSVCNIGSIRFECAPTLQWVIDLGPVANCGGGPATTCSPFLWSCSGSSFGTCSGTFTLTITQ